MNSWQAAVKRCFRDRRTQQGEKDATKDEDASNGHVENNDDKNRRKLLAKEKAILDYDQATRNVIISIISSRVKSGETDQEVTKELCRFAL